ncbi:MAG: LCCL domain-containing protein, partial [Anaerolinea sp.]|nr:LCCL domain-containing protein [Anaerolinea sp.]
VQFGLGGAVSALDVIINPATTTLGGMFSLEPLTGAAGVRLVDNVLYLGMGASADALTWNSLDLNTAPLNLNFNQSTPMAALGDQQNWQRAQDVSVIPGVATTAFESIFSTGSIDSGIENLGALMGGEAGALVESLIGSIGSQVQVGQIGRLLVEPGAQLIRGFSLLDVVDLSGSAGSTDMDTLAQGGVANGTTTFTEIIFRNYNVDHAFVAPPNATPMTPDQVGSVLASGSGDLGTLITQYFLSEGSMMATAALEDMDPNALLGGLFGGMGTDADALAGLLGGMFGGMGAGGDFGSMVSNPVTIARSIAIGETLNGNLTSGRSDGYLIDVTAGTTVQINMDADFDTYLEIRDSSGTQVAYNDDFNGLNSQITYTFPATGQFTIVARGFSSTASGPYTLTVAPAQALPSGGPIGIGQTVSGTLMPGARDQWTFSASGGERIRINMDAEFDTYLELLGPDGARIAENDDFNGLDSQIDITLPAAGTYTIIARSFASSGSGQYTLSVQLAQAGGTSTGGSLTGGATGSLTGAATTTGSLTGGATASAGGGAISIGQTVSGNIAPGVIDQWTIALTQGQTIQINMDGEFDTVLELRDANGTQVAFNDDFNGLDSQITYQVAASGTHTILARAFGSFNGGPYTLSVQLVQPSGTSTGGSATGSLTGAATTATPVTCPENAQTGSLRNLSVGQSAVVLCPAGCAANSQAVWGSNFYTDDSSICRAAIHAGVITDQGGPVRVTIAPGQQSYTGSAQNGITTANWGQWNRSFTVSAPR